MKKEIISIRRSHLACAGDIPFRVVVPKLGCGNEAMNKNKFLMSVQLK
jgi:hypothetical protein